MRYFITKAFHVCRKRHTTTAPIMAGCFVILNYKIYKVMSSINLKLNA
jgi:hypothetical protein